MRISVERVERGHVLRPLVPNLRDLDVPLLEGLSAVDRQLVLDSAKLKRFAANTAVSRQEHSDDYMYLLIRGRARYFYVTHDGQKILLRWFKPGEIFGGMTMLQRPACYLMGTEVLTDSSAMVWDREGIRQLVAQYPRLLDNALTIAAEYSAMLLASLIAVSCRTAKERLAETLITLAQSVGHMNTHGVEIDVTNEELAQAAHVTLFTASRQLSDWSRLKVLMKKRGKIVLRSPERLFRP